MTTKNLSTTVKLLVPVLVVAAMTAMNFDTALKITHNGKVLQDSRETLSNEKLMMKRKALRGVTVKPTEPEYRRLNDNAAAYSSPDENGVAESEGVSWGLSSGADKVEETIEDSLSLNGVNEELTQNAVGNVTNVTKAVSDGEGGGGGGGTGYAYSYNGGSSQGSGQGAGEGKGGGTVLNSDGSMSDGGGDGNGNGSGLAYAYSKPGGKSSSSGSGNGAGYGDGAAANTNGEDDDTITGLSQNAVTDDLYGGYGGYGDGNGNGRGRGTFGTGIASAFSEGSGQAFGYGTGSGVSGGNGLSQQSRPAQGFSPNGFGFDLDDEDYTTDGTTSQNSATGPITFGQGVGRAGNDGIGIGIGIGIGPSTNSGSGGDGDDELDGEDAVYSVNSASGNNTNTQRLTITLDITS